VTSYERLHEWIRASFARLGVVSELALQSSKERPGQCFAGPEKFDVVRQGRKVAGAAQRRNRHGLLIQGSIQAASAAVSRADWERALCVTGEEDMRIEWQPFTIPTWLEARARALTDQKYSRPEYNLRRTGSSTFPG
jgi:lipoate-protein ligase A